MSQRSRVSRLAVTALTIPMLTHELDHLLPRVRQKYAGYAKAPRWSRPPAASRGVGGDSMTSGGANRMVQVWVSLGEDAAGESSASLTCQAGTDPRAQARSPTAALRPQRPQPMAAPRSRSGRTAAAAPRVRGSRARPSPTATASGFPPRCCRARPALITPSPASPRQQPKQQAPRQAPCRYSPARPLRRRRRTWIFPSAPRPGLGLVPGHEHTRVPCTAPARPAGFRAARGDELARSTREERHGALGDRAGRSARGRHTDQPEARA